MSYQDALRLFSGGLHKHKTSGFYQKDFTAALAKAGYQARGYSASRWGRRRVPPGTIVFAKRSKRYPEGHFLLKAKQGWMDPWKTGKTIEEAKAGWRSRFPGTKDWFITTQRISE